MSDMHGDAGEGNRRLSASEGVITRIKTDYESRKQKRRNVQENRKQKQSFSWVPAFLINLFPAYKYSRVSGTEDFGMCNRK